MTPITRQESYLAKIAGDDVEIPSTPLTREEAYLARIAEGGGSGGVTDVQIDGTSIASSGVANIPVASYDNLGAVKISTTYGIDIRSGSSNPNYVTINPASNAQIKSGIDYYCPITPLTQHQSTFFALAKAAGDDTQSASSNSVGTYTETAKSKISDMLSAPETVTGVYAQHNGKSGSTLHLRRVQYVSDNHTCQRYYRCGV